MFSYRDHMGESILHLWIEKMREHIQKTNLVLEQNDSCETQESSQVEVTKKLSVLDVEDSKEECPLIISADPFTERKSTFQGHVATVTNVSQVKYSNTISLFMFVSYKIANI